VKTILQSLTPLVFVAATGCAHRTAPPSASKPLAAKHRHSDVIRDAEPNATSGPDPGGYSTAMFPLAPADRDRERELRARFAQFWSTATGDRRTVYDTFISATPFAEGVSSEQVETASVRGWWVRPSVAEHDGLILYLHGGGYVAGSAKAYRGLASQLAGRTRRAVFVLDYPLAPEATVPAAPDAVMAAYEWLRTNGSVRVAFVGDSAGGGLSLVTLAQLAHTSQPSAAIAGVAFSPWVDLAFTGASMRDGHIEDPLLTYKYLQAGARMYLGGADSHDPLASPLFGDLSRLPPLLIQVGSDERLLDDARQYAERAAGAGSQVRLEVWQGMHHVFQVNVSDLQTSGVALDRAAAFLVEAFSNS